ncbi:MAG: phosphatidate cytidylyltransferase [Elusimicrobiota bacterium]|jgi:phosphatidate cytidylyltransferase|nr:phosphatidate cytidylyltransferase [Elusimicrobiota bacterium]
MLKTRILTALIGIPIIFICIYIGGWLFFSLMFLINFFCVKEYLSICKKYQPHTTASLIISILYFISLGLPQHFQINYLGPIQLSQSAVLMAYAVLIFLVFFVIEVIHNNPEKAVKRISISFLGSFFFPTTLYFMVLIRDLYNGMAYIFLIFVTVWILDTAAFAVGKKFGKHKLSSNISPKKTIEGAIAGIVFGVLFSVVIGTYVFNLFYAWQSAILGLVISVLGQFSDLAESLIKRDAGIKDSGTIVPGHGGVLDRFDSYFFAAPIVYYVLIFLQGFNLLTKG